MIARLRDILVIGLSGEDEKAVWVAKHLAAANSAHLTALLVKIAEEPILAFDGFGLAYAGGAWMGDLPPGEQNAPKRIDLSWRFRAALRAATVETVECGRGSAGKRAAFEARHADLIVMSRPERGKEQAHRQLLFCDVLFHSGRPLLLVPTTWSSGSVGRDVVVAWNGRREAARALAGSEAILEQAERITIIMVDDGQNPDGLAGSAKIVRHLERRGHKIQARVLQSNGSRIEDVLLGECEALDADLLVMGGYGHSRLEEFAFGGITRSLVRSSPVPLLLAH
jgi:nucleotide-binding universal stress UspA family protein